MLPKNNNNTKTKAPLGAF